MTAYDRLTDALRTAGMRVTHPRDGQAKSQCPAHDDRDPSLSLTWIEDQVLVYCHAGCHTEDVLAALDLTMPDLFDEPRGASYRYDDGRIVHRTPDKRFRQSGHTTGTGQLYRLAEVKQAIANGTTIYIVEGEKDVHALEAIGVVATCSPMGAGKWHKADPSPLHGANIVVVADKDEPGEKHANDVFNSLTGKAQSIRIVRAKAGKDSADHIAAGYGVEDFDDHQTGDTRESGPRPWQAVNLEAVLDGSWQPPMPTVGHRTDGVGLLYPGKCHTASGESEGGKSWLALTACLDEMDRGNRAVYIDFEDDEGSTVGRLLMMGAGRDQIRNLFTYLKPWAAVGGNGINRADLTEVLGDTTPTIAILDGVTEALALHGYDANKNNEVAAFGQTLPTWIANRGPAVLSLDHVTKNGEGRGRYAIGAVHKLNGLNGAAYVVENRHPFSIGKRGVSYVKIAKDRPGQLRRHAPESSGGLHWFADLVLDATGDAGAEASVEIVPPQIVEGTFRPTVIMTEIMALITARGPLSKRMIRIGVKGKNETIDAALDQLILDGYLGEKTPHAKLKDWLGQ